MENNLIENDLLTDGKKLILMKYVAPVKTKTGIVLTTSFDGDVNEEERVGSFELFLILNLKNFKPSVKYVLIADKFNAREMSGELLGADVKNFKYYVIDSEDVLLFQEFDKCVLSNEVKEFIRNNYGTR